MDLSPHNHKRCDSKLCQYGNVCNLVALCLTLVLIAGFAQAEMSLDRLILDFQPGDSHHKDIQVFNNDKKNLYVNVSVSEVLEPGTEHEKRILVKDLEKRPLVATPQKLIVSGNSQKNVRLVSLEDAGKTDRIFRVNFSPALGELKAKASGIKILIAYQALIIVRANTPVAKVVAERKGNKIVFKNTGNTNVILQNGSQCNPEAIKECEKLNTRRLYAGNVWELTMPFNAPVTYDLDDGVKVITQTFGVIKKSAWRP